jgi:hypothetical protein
MGVKKESGERREGHGDTSTLNTSVRKGTFMQVGTVIPLNHKPVSTDMKSGHEGGGEKHG